MLNLGSADHFRALRDFLKERYTEEIAAAALGVPRIAAFDQRDNRLPIRDTLVRFFFGGAAVPAPELHKAVSGRVFDAMAALGLVQRAGDALWCPYILYPTHDLHMVSDRFMQPDGTPAAPDREFVYFALTANTQTYLDMLPDTPCDSFLDLGAGCGAAALVQARYAAKSCAADISARSTLFARFNAVLNDLSHVDAVEGSLYDPVANRRFDRIGCHPPYDISSSSPWTFADGGDDGEFVIRGTVSGLPDHLAPGGRFFSLFRGADRHGQPLEQRVRGWLGERHAEFDIALVVRGIVGVQDYAVGSVLSTTRDFNLYESYIRRFSELKVEQLVYSSLLIRRKTDRCAPLTLRRDLGERCTSLELEWLLDWEAAAPHLDISGFVLRAAPDMELSVRHRMAHGDLRPLDYALRSQTPFSATLDCPEWIAVLVSKFAPARRCVDVYEEMHAESPVAPEQFSAAVKRLVSAGVLQVASGSSMTSSS